MLLLREAGIDTCPQADWAMHAGAVKTFLGVPPDWDLVCGMAVGYLDPTAPINRVRSERDDPFATPWRMPLDEMEG
ncbi:Nitroreductase family protein [Arboricoccus pini]|uniref:Nitroreductase family protein n=1 Tax=Arboricoccus pini TaxID=1963835 RepID=A0A212RUT0_9PROT|nr:Nitroreductase family protein [Arboricoccus pini]